MKTIKKLANTILAGLLSVLSFPWSGEAETISAGNSKTVTGYATQIEQVFDFSIYWQAMTFVFDRGKYDVTTGTLVRASSAPGAEKEKTDGQINCWYGFDGINNGVLILNRSNIDVYATYESEINADVCGGNVKSEIYGYDELCLPINAKNGIPTEDGNEEEMGRFGNIAPEYLQNGQTISASKGDGYMYARKIFLNITGTPDDGFTTSEDNKAEMGSITINLNKGSTSGDSTT